MRNERAVTERVLGALGEYGTSNDPSMIGPLRVLYREWLEVSEPEQRMRYLQATLEGIEGRELVSNVLLPFVGCETDGRIASMAAMSFAMMHPTSAEEAMLGVVLLSRGLAGGTMNNPGAVFGGLLNVGDYRVNRVLWPLRETMVGDDLDEVVRVQTGRAAAAVVDFLLDWLEQMPEAARATQFNPLLAALVNQRTGSQIDLVAIGGRAWPVADVTPEEEDYAADYVPMGAYARSIMARLEALRSIAPEPEIIDYVVAAWAAETEEDEDEDEDE
jgi:hypothetical protein